HVVAGADRHLVDPGEDVELGQHDVGEAVDAHGVPDHQRVVPAAAAGAAGVHAHLAAGDLQVLAPLVLQLGGARAGAPSRGVRRDDPDHAVDAGGAAAGARAGSARGGVGAGHERVGAVVDVQVGGLAALHQHRLVAVQGV